MSSLPHYELIYHNSIPGRGEHVRLILEEGGASWSDQNGWDWDKCFEYVNTHKQGQNGNPPSFAPPMLKTSDGLIISQTSNILLYLGTRLGLSGRGPPGSDDTYRVNGLALTALDGLSDEVHDCHHPIASALYWEDQKAESHRRSVEFVKSRLGQHLQYWESVLKSSSEGTHGIGGAGPWLMGSTLTYADLVLFQCLDGTMFAFPKAIAQAKETGKYDRVFKLYEDVKTRPRIASYLASDRRQKYSMGIYRYYPENDVVSPSP